MKLAACFHFSLDEPPVDAEPRPAWGTLFGEDHLMDESLVACTWCE